MSIVNGIGNPRLEIKKKTGTTVVIDLPSPGPGGNIEIPNEDVTLHDAFDHVQIEDKNGFKPRFTLDYSDAIDGVELLTLRHILERDVDEIVLIPHVDLPGRKFKVRVVKFGQIQRIGTDSGHKGVRLEFESVELLDAMPFPQAAWSGKTWGDLTAVHWSDLTTVVWHFFR